MWQGGGVLFLIAQMSQNSFDDVLIFDATVRRSDDNFDRPTAAGADHDVYIEYALEPLSPGRCCMSLRCRADLSIGNRLGIFSAPGWRDQPTPAVVWRQNAVIAGEVDAGFGYQGSQTGHEIHRIERHLRRSIAVGRLQGVDHLALFNGMRPPSTLGRLACSSIFGSMNINISSWAEG